MLREQLREMAETTPDLKTEVARLARRLDAADSQVRSRNNLLKRPSTVSQPQPRPEMILACSLK